MKPSDYAAIERRYGFSIPMAYRELERRGFLDRLATPAYYAEFTTPGRGYLWLGDMEWYTPRQIADFEFADYHLPGFVPFAFTGGGDYWCWQPRFTDDRGTRVVLCPHDYELGTVYAPNFGAALYRQVLEYSAQGFLSEDEVAVARAMLKRWAVDLACVLPAAWCERVEAISRVAATVRSGRDRKLVLISEEALNRFESADLAFPEIDSEFHWMQPSTSPP